MTSSLNSNNLSLRVQRSLNDASQRVYSAFEKLSTGSRINKASDDAAGLAIADSLRVNSRLQTTGIRNVNDGISAINIIDGTLNDQTSILTRLLELAEQSVNGTFSSTQRRSLNEEYYKLVQEFGRLGTTTSFNGVNLLLGGRGSYATSLGLQAGITGEASSQIGMTLSDTGRVSGILNVDNLTNLVPSGNQTLDNLVSVNDGRLLRTTLTDAAGVSHDVLIAPYTLVSVGSTSTFRYAVYARANETTTGASSPSDNWTLLVNAGGPATISFNRTTGEFTTHAGKTFSGFLSGTPISTVSLDFSGLTYANTGQTDINSNTTSIDFSGVESQTQAQNALDVVRRRLDELENIKGSFGALQSRLDISKNLLLGSRENTIAAESRIRDVDVAEETSGLVAAQIQQQSASSVLKLANLQPQLLISLITDAEG